MEIARYGRTVIVDDQMEDIIDLIKTLSKEGISTTYFTGEVEGLPDNPMEGVSLLFLDLELNKNVVNDRDKASQDISVIQKILGKHAYDGTVVLIVWTSAIAAYDELKRIMSQVKMRFLTEIQIEKSSCKTGSTFEFAKIQKVLDNELTKLGSLRLMNFWDNTINIASHRVYERLINNAPYDHTKLNRHINTLYSKMAEAIRGKQIDISIVTCIVQVLNEILANEICMSGLTEYSYELSEDDIDALSLDKIGNLNKALNLVPVQSGSAPGTVYELQEKIKLNYFEIFNDWKKLKKSVEFEKKREVMCEVTPLCDYAQKRRKVCRLLPGVILPVCLEDSIKSRADYLYLTPVFNDENVFSEPFIMVFDLRLLFTIDESDMSMEGIGMQFGPNLLMHLQNRLGRQVSNPGITVISRKNG